MLTMWGRELRYKPDVNFLTRIYAYFFGNPNIGEYIRNMYFRNAIKNIDFNGKNILDAGCGWGPYTYYIAGKYPQAIVDSCDFSDSTVNKCRTIANKCRLSNIKFFTQDLANIYVENKYDIIICIDVIEHIKDDYQVIKNFYRALKKGGVLYLSTPCKDFRAIISSKFSRDIRNFEEHIHKGYTKERIRFLLEDSGFIIEELRYTWKWWAELIWEINGFGNSASNYLKALTSPFLKLLLPLDIYIKSKNGNNISALARKK